MLSFPFFCLSDYILRWQDLSLADTVEKHNNERKNKEMDDERKKEKKSVVINLKAIQSLRFPVWQRL